MYTRPCETSHDSSNTAGLSLISSTLPYKPWNLTELSELRTQVKTWSVAILVYTRRATYAHAGDTRISSQSIHLRNTKPSLSPPQKPLSCCFDRKGFLAVGLKRKNRRSRGGNAGKGKERGRGSQHFPLPIIHRAPSQTQYYSKISHRKPLRRRMKPDSDTVLIIYIINRS